MRSFAGLACLSLGILAGACGAEPPPPPNAVQAMPPPPAEVGAAHGATIEVSVARDAATPAVSRAMSAAAREGGVPCPKGVFVWGNLRELGDARPMHVAAGGASLSGFVVCEMVLPTFLTAQRDNPRLAGKHGGSCNLRWADRQLYMRRSSSDLGEAALGDLSADTSEVLQKSELLAAIYDPLAAYDASATAEPVLTVLARVPKFFLFGMWPLPAP